MGNRVPVGNNAPLLTRFVWWPCSGGDEEEEGLGKTNNTKRDTIHYSELEFSCQWAHSIEHSSRDALVELAIILPLPVPSPVAVSCGCVFLRNGEIVTIRAIAAVL